MDMLVLFNRPLEESEKPVGWKARGRGASDTSCRQTRSASHIKDLLSTFQEQQIPPSLGMRHQIIRGEQ